jgi:predicted HicB family RNase H-like nuclease
MTTPQHIFTVRMPPEVRTQLESIAAQLNISLNAALIVAVQESFYARNTSTDTTAARAS